MFTFSSRELILKHIRTSVRKVYCHLKNIGIDLCDSTPADDSAPLIFAPDALQDPEKTHKSHILSGSRGYERSTSLIIRAVNQSDSGTYRCSALNERGNNDAVLQLNVCGECCWFIWYMFQFFGSMFISNTFLQVHRLCGLRIHNIYKIRRVKRKRSYRNLHFVRTVKLNKKNLTPVFTLKIYIFWGVIFYLHIMQIRKYIPQANMKHYSKCVIIN